MWRFFAAASVLTVLILAISGAPLAPVIGGIVLGALWTWKGPQIGGRSGTG